MDPNKLLEEIRTFSGVIRDTEGDTPAEAVALAERMDALDEWLSKGGFLPGDWAR